MFEKGDKVWSKEHRGVRWFPATVTGTYRDMLITEGDGVLFYGDRRADDLRRRDPAENGKDKPDVEV